MRVEDVKYLSKLIMEAGEVPLVWGHFGVGKTDVAREIAEETGRNLIILVISQMEPGDLIGLPSREGDRTVFLRPDWWPESGDTLIMIDEVNRAHKSIRNAIMQLLIDKRIHNHILPEGTWVMAAANPPDEDYDQVELITDPAFMSRFFHLEITPDAEEWIVWAEKNGVPETIRSFIDDYPEFLIRDTVVSMRLQIRPSPRSWYKLGRVLSRMSEGDIKRYGYVLAAGIVGAEAARVFLDHLEGVVELPSPEEVFFEMNESMEKRFRKASTAELTSLIVRLNDYLERMDNDKAKKLVDSAPKVAESIARLTSLIPKDMAFSIIRHLENLSNKSSTFRFVYDALLEELATYPEISSVVGD
ncbi:MAG: hypothetical protein PWP09_587 [Thermotogota bacterium]|nr:hypothetical protein [Thermotogota bacterium]